MSLICFPMSIGFMSHVILRKDHVALSNLGVKGPTVAIHPLEVCIHCAYGGGSVTILLWKRHQSYQSERPIFSYKKCQSMLSNK